MSSLTFYGGVNEIGGNKILLEDKGTRIFLDFGMSFGKEGEFYSDFMGPRSKGCLRDSLHMNIVPRIDGIYRDDLVHVQGVEKILQELGVEETCYWEQELQSYGEAMKRDGKPWLSGVLLSHAHVDHFGYISYLDPRVPIYCSDVSKQLLGVMEDISGCDFATVKPFEMGRVKTGACADKPKIVGGGEVVRDVRTFSPGEAFKIGKLQIQTFAVDHSVLGAVAYLVTTSDGKRILYTGDFRFHGKLSNETKLFRKAVRGLEPDAMICEGTRVDETEPDSEERVQSECTELVSKTKGFVGVEFAWKDLTRFETMREVARASGRTFVMSARTAYLLNKMGRGDEVEKDSSVSVYVPRKDGMIYSPADYNRVRYVAGFDPDWDEEPDIRHLKNGVRAYHIKGDPSRYLMHLAFWEFNELIDLQPPEGSLFISACSEPYSDEGMIEEGQKKAWMRHFRLNPPDHELPHIHASGHISGAELKGFVQEVKPKQLFPVHTEHPDVFLGLAKKVYEKIKLGETYGI